MKKNLLLAISLFALGLFIAEPLSVISTSARTLAGIDDQINTSSGQYYSLQQPIRLFSTQPGETACINSSAPLTGGLPRTIPTRVTCAGNTIPANAIALTGNLIITNFNPDSGSITVYPSDDNPPDTTNAQYGPSQIVTKAFTVGLGSDGAFKILASSSNVNIVVDITGYFAPPAANGLYYHPLPTPGRLLNTQPGGNACFTTDAPLTGGTERIQQAGGTCSIPATARAIAGNATVVNPSGLGFLTLYPSDSSSTIPILNYFTNQTASNAFTVGLSGDGKFNILPSATTHVIIDVTGYFSNEVSDENGPGLIFRPVTPCRVADTRNPIGELGGPALTAGATRTFPIRSSPCGIPSTARAYSMNMTVVPSGPLNSLTLWPTGQPQPNVSTLQSPDGHITTNAAIVPAGTDGAINVLSSDDTNIILDINGYFTDDAPKLNITGAALNGKNLEVNVEGLAGGASNAELASIEAQAKGPVILVDGVERKTTQIDATTLASKKAGKKIKKLPSGTQVRLQVRGTDGRISEEFIFVRP